MLSTMERYEMLQAFIRQLQCIIRDNDAESAWKQIATACENFADFARYDE